MGIWGALKREQEKVGGENWEGEEEKVAAVPPVCARKANFSQKWEKINCQPRSSLAGGERREVVLFWNLWS